MKIHTKLGIVALILLALVAAGYFMVKRSIDDAFRDGSLERLVARKSGAKLGADECGYLPLAWREMLIRSDGVLARGKPPRSLTVINATNIRAHCSLRNLLQRKWTVTLLEASHLQAAFGEGAAVNVQQILPRQPELEPRDDAESLVKVDIHETHIPRTDVYWGKTTDHVGGFKEVDSWFYTKGHDHLDIAGRGGTFRQTGWPELKVDQLRLHWVRPKLQVESAFFSVGQPANLHVTGELDFNGPFGMQLHLSVKQSPAEPFLMGYWRGKFDSVFDSETDLEKQSGADTKVTASGEFNFSHSVVHDVDVLAKIAAVTRHPQFEKPKIDVLRFHYRWTGTQLEVSHFEAETKGLCRLEGDFSLDNSNIDGNFKVGAAPDVVDALPGAREKVFTESHDGYLWTTWHLSGPTRHPREDLTPRLVAAAQEHFAKGFLAPIFKPGKGVIDLLQEIYK